VTPKDRRTGRVSFLDSTTANSGYYCRSDIDIFYYTGNERITVGFDLPNAANVLNTTIIMGTGDVVTAAEPTDGCYLYSVNRKAQGRCKNNAGPTKTASNITLLTNQNYILEIYSSPTASLITFNVYNYSSCTNESFSPRFILHPYSVCYRKEKGDVQCPSWTFGQPSH
jgi:hypothetical protein